MSQSRNDTKTPVLLLKTKSVPHDGYEEYFSDQRNGDFEPTFVPVLEHRFQEDALERIRTWLAGQPHAAGPNPEGQFPYGGIIFTSQRAVEAFSRIVTDLRAAGNGTIETLGNGIPLYVVGPATARGLRALDLPCPIVGEDSGNGEALAHIILQDYADRPVGQGFAKLPLLFLVGEQRRDIIPKTLQSDALPERERIQVDEVVIYETGEMQSFREDIKSIWTTESQRGFRELWVVIFSPTGCKALLDTLELQKTGGKLETGSSDARNTFIATIGPTTRDFLVKEFNYAPDICALKPSPEGIGHAIRDYIQQRTRSAGIEQNFATQIT